MTTFLEAAHRRDQENRNEGMFFGRELWWQSAKPIGVETMIAQERQLQLVRRTEIEGVLEIMKPGEDYGHHLASGKFESDEAGLWYYGMKSAKEQKIRLDSAKTIVVMCNLDGLGDSVRQVQVALLLAHHYPDKQIVSCINHDIFDSNHPECPKNLSFITMKRGTWPENYLYNRDVVFVSPSLEDDYTNGFNKLIGAKRKSWIGRMIRRALGLEDFQDLGDPKLFPSDLAYKGWSMFPEAINYHRLMSISSTSGIAHNPICIEEHMLSFYLWLLSSDINGKPFPYPIFQSVAQCSEFDSDARPSVGIFIDAKEKGRSKMLDAYQWGDLISRILRMDFSPKVILFEGLEHQNEADAVIAQGDLTQFQPVKLPLQSIQSGCIDQQIKDVQSKLIVAGAFKDSMRPAIQVLSRCKVIISVDTVWVHVGNALQIPTLCIGGSKGVFDLGYYGPIDNGSMTIFGHELASSVSVNEAFPTVKKWIQSHV